MQLSPHGNRMEVLGNAACLSWANPSHPLFALFPLYLPVIYTYFLQCLISFQGQIQNLFTVLLHIVWLTFDLLLRNLTKTCS